MSVKKYKPRMAPNNPDKLNVARTFFIGFGFLTTSAAWSYYNFMMPLILRQMITGIFADSAWISSIVGLIMIFDNLVAVSLQPYFGALSDRMMSKYGRRIPFIFIGSMVGAISFAILPYIGVLGGLIGVIMLFNLAMAFYRAPVVALMPDYTPYKVRSTGNAIINLMGGVGGVIGFLAPTIVEAIFGEIPEGLYVGAIQTQTGFLIVSVIILISLLLLLLTVKETPTGDKLFEIAENSIKIDPITLELVDEDKEDENESSKKKESKWADLIIVFKEEEKSALFMLLMIFSWFFGFNAMETFFSTFAVEYLEWDIGIAGLAFALVPIMLIVTAYPNGLLAEKIGRKKTITIGLIGLTVCFIILFLIIVLISGDLNFIFSICVLLFVGVFFGMVNINTIAVVWELAPEGKTGAYTGVYYIFSQMSAIMSPLIAGITFDIYRILVPSLASGQEFILLFPYLILWEIIAGIFLSRVKRGEAREE
ncbi:MAG: SLC45 family MFS transporter [archaeon]|nr:SLC45 family MFS transporter [archaeon]